MDNELFELAEQLGRLLKSKEKKIATAESCTGGWIAQNNYRGAGKFRLV